MAIKDSLNAFIGRNGAGKPTPRQLEILNNQRRSAMGRAVAKGFIIAPDAQNPVLETPLVLRFQFNPTEYTKSKGVNYGVTEIPGAINPLVEFIAGKETTYNMELVFYAPQEEELADFSIKERNRIAEFGYVQYQLDCLSSLMSSESRFSPPPIVTFFMPHKVAVSEADNAMSSEELAKKIRNKGTRISAVVKDVKVTVLAQDKFLRPIHAKADITLLRVSAYKKRAEVKKRTVVGIRDAVVSRPDRSYKGPTVELTIEYLKKKYAVTTWPEVARAADSLLWSCYLLNPKASPRIIPLLESFPSPIVTQFVKVPKKGRFANEKSFGQLQTGVESGTYDVNVNSTTPHYVSRDME